MRCIRCGAETTVLETRGTTEEFVNRRRRQCTQDSSHRFFTYEVASPVWGSCKARAADFASTARARIAVYVRNATVVAGLLAGRRGIDIAIEHGVSKSLVTLIRKQAKLPMRSEIRVRQPTWTSGLGAKK